MVGRMNEIWPFSKAKSIFDTGCGPGVVVSHIIQEHGKEIPASAKILAGDFSEPMLDAARKLKKERSFETDNIWDRVELRNIDAQDLSAIPDGSVSHATGGFVFFMLPDPRKALRETNRVLCDGGVLALSSWQSSEWMDTLTLAFERVNPKADAPKLVGPWTTTEGVQVELKATGFADVEAQYVVASFNYKTHEEVADMLMDIPATNNAVQGMSEQEVAQLRQTILDHLVKHHPAAPGTMKGVTIAAVACKPRTAAGL
jgi:ubiquinone/menaquinone biosynthesis C-methylase UbiE